MPNEPYEFSESDANELRAVDGAVPLSVELVDGITSLTSVLSKGVGFATCPQVGDRLLMANCGAYTSAQANATRAVLSNQEAAQITGTQACVQATLVLRTPRSPNTVTWEQH